MSRMFDIRPAGFTACAADRPSTSGDNGHGADSRGRWMDSGRTATFLWTLNDYGITTASLYVFTFDGGDVCIASTLTTAVADNSYTEDEAGFAGVTKRDVRWIMETMAASAREGTVEII